MSSAVPCGRVDDRPQDGQTLGRHLQTVLTKQRGWVTELFNRQ